MTTVMRGPAKLCIASQLCKTEPKYLGVSLQLRLLLWGVFVMILEGNVNGLVQILRAWSIGCWYGGGASSGRGVSKATQLGLPYEERCHQSNPPLSSISDPKATSAERLAVAGVDTGASCCCC